MQKVQVFFCHTVLFINQVRLRKTFQAPGAFPMVGYSLHGLEYIMLCFVYQSHVEKDFCRSEREVKSPPNSGMSPSVPFWK